MKVIHIGPPLARLGGPAGYLDQLASARIEPSEHEVLFPPRAIPQPKRKPTLTEKLRKEAGKLKRSVLGAPTFYRPSEIELQTLGGQLHSMFNNVAEQTIASAAETIQLALASPDARVLFTHDPLVSEHLLEHRLPDQKVCQKIWMMIHTPFPVALYFAWCWGVPERDWREVLQFPDVQRWVERELTVWRNVDQLILPCAEAGEEFLRIDPRFGECLSNVTYLMTGAAGTAPQKKNVSRAALRAEWKLPADVPLGLYLGNDQPYRGLDALFAALPHLPPESESPGKLVIAGPDPDKLPKHARVHALGRVADVSSLLAAVDFVVNVNRFSLFDLSTIEALEAGKPLLLHATGGNKTFRDLGAGCVMLPDLHPEVIAAGLETMFTLTHEELAGMKEASQRCYAEHLTPAHLWQRHQLLYSFYAA
ncbi:MAG: glycosyltransferase [Acidobacteriota bacterium]|nr:glycosyltransferase [Acidobacteriota bacterium]